MRLQKGQFERPKRKLEFEGIQTSGWWEEIYYKSMYELIKW